jgi:ankyrin repeat protein
MKFDLSTVLQDVTQTRFDDSSVSFGWRRYVASAIDARVSVEIFSLLVNANPSVIDDELFEVAAYAPQAHFLRVLLAARPLIDSDKKQERLQKLLMRAVAPDTVKLLLGLGADVRAVNRDGETLLHRCCGHSNFYDRDTDKSSMRQVRLRSVSLAIAAGADVNAVDKQGQTPLHMALRIDDDLARCVVKALIGAGCDVNAADSYGVTPLALALRLKLHHSAVIRELIKAGADMLQLIKNRFALVFVLFLPGGDDLLEFAIETAAFDINATNSFGETLLHDFARSVESVPDPERMLAAFVRFGAKIDVENNVGETPLAVLLSSSGVTADILLAFLDAGANAKTRSRDGVTVCHLAAQWCDDALLELLVNKYDVDPSVATDIFDTPLMIATEHGAETMVSWLLAQPGYDDAMGVWRYDDMSTFVAAVCGSHRNILEALIEAGVDLDDEPDTLCNTAAALGDVEILGRLIDVGFDVDEVTKTGDTPLHIAATSRTSGAAMMRRLIAAGANVHAVNNRGQTVAHIALRNSDTWDVIRSQFTLFDHEDADGWTPLALAARLGRGECVLEMIAAGANAAHINRDGSSLLHLFLAQRSNVVGPGLIRALMASGAVLNSCNANGEDLADAAVRYCCEIVIKSLFAIGVDFRNGVRMNWRWIRGTSNDAYILAAGAEESAVQSEDLNVVLFSDIDNRGDIACDRARVALARQSLVRARGVEVCIGLQSLRLDALQLCEIMTHSCAPAAKHVPFHELWNIATMVKHFCDKRQ